MRRRLLLPALVAFTLAGCGEASSPAAEQQQAQEPLASTLAGTATTVVSTSTAPSNDEPGADETSTSVVESATSVAVATTAAAPRTTVAATQSTLAPGASTTVAPTTTSRTVGTPRLTVSQTASLDPSGVKVTVRGTGYDISKGVYVIVCNQAAWTDARRCVGGVNIDGSSPVSEWVSSNPPAYAKGLTVPFAVDGSFSITLLVRALGDAIDCTKEQCGVVTFADHTRREDRSQDAFVPITFRTGG